MTKYFLHTFIVTLYCTAIFAQPEQIPDRATKRFIHPKSKYLTFSAGFGFTSIATKDPNNFLRQGILMGNNTYVPEIRYEHGIKNSIFAEIGISQIGQGIFKKMRFGDDEVAFYNRLYKSYYTDFGAGYRLKNANNFHFANFHAGIFLSVANANRANIPNEYGVLVTDNNFNSTLITTNILKFQPIGFGSYIGISKDFRLSKDVRFFVKYIQRFGLVNTLSGTFGLSSQSTDFDASPASFKVRGGGAFITGGLKILLFKKKLEL